MPKQQRRKSDIRESLVDQIVASKPQSKILGSRKQINLFLRQYFRNVPYEDLSGRSPTIMGQAALAHLELAKSKRKKESLLRIFNPTVKEHGYESAYTIIEMVNDNMPFLVDSVSAAITRQNLGIHITIHPIMRIQRDAKHKIQDVIPISEDGGRAESFVRFVVDKETDEHHLKIIEHEINKVLSDVRLAVRDWLPMRIKMQEAKELLRFGPPGADADLRQESQALLQWMANDHFTFLGYREYVLKKRSQKMYLQPIKGTGMGVLANEERGVRAIELTRQMQRLTRSKDWLIITKANSRSTVHRHSYLDYVGVKKYDEDGNPVGEMRFIGLFTSVAYSENPRNIPLLRLKVNRVVERSGFDSSSHLGKALLHVLDNFPRDELFQASIQDLVRTTNGVLNLQERHKVRLFVRRDTFRRFFLLHRLHPAREIHDRGSASGRGNSHRGIRRHRGRFERRNFGLAAGAGPYHRARTRRRATPCEGGGRRGHHRRGRGDLAGSTACLSRTPFWHRRRSHSLQRLRRQLLPGVHGRHRSFNRLPRRQTHGRLAER